MMSPSAAAIVMAAMLAADTIGAFSGRFRLSAGRGRWPIGSCRQVPRLSAVRGAGRDRQTMRPSTPGVRMPRWRRRRSGAPFRHTRPLLVPVALEGPVRRQLRVRILVMPAMTVVASTHPASETIHATHTPAPVGT